MQLFKDFIELEEALITVGGKAYPKHGNIVIMAGGAGSGKGFIKDKLLGMEGKVFDVDELKKLAMKTPLIIKHAKDKYGIDISKLNLKNPADVSKIHELLNIHMGLDSRKLEIAYTSILSAPPDRKPNLIFDVTLKDMQKLANLTRLAQDLNYDPKKIHIVWVINDLNIALKQNAERERTLDAEILINTHRGVSSTMYDIISMGKQLSKYMDGDIVFAFNKVGIDSDLKVSKKGGSYIKKSNYFYVKRAGKQVTDIEQITKDIRAKIAGYVPKGVTWV